MQWRKIHYLTRIVKVLKYLKFPTLNLLLWACADEFLAMVTEGVVHGVYKVVTWSSYGVEH